MSQFSFGSSSSSLSLPSATNAFNFGTTTAQTSLPTLSSLSTTTPFSFNTSGTTTTTQPSMMSFLSTPTLTLTTSSTAVTQTSTLQSNTFHGLGGTQTIASDGRIDETSNASKSNKESTCVPPEIIPLVESFKQFVKEQKMIREENSQQRFSIQPILEVGSELEDNLKVNLHKIEIEIQRNSKSIDALKRDTNKLLSNAEMAYRISRVDLPQTPSSYTIAQNKYINASTHQYFMEMIDNFETQMNNYSKQIKELQIHIDYMNRPYSSEELFQIMRKQHETLISLAAKVYAIHEEINQLKHKLKTQTNFSSKTVDSFIESKTDNSSNRHSFLGPNPFSLTGDESLIGSAIHSSQQQNIQNPIGFGNQSLFGSTQPITTTVSTFHFSTPTTSSSTSHSRTKRFTTS